MTSSVGGVEGDARGKAERGGGANDGKIFLQGLAAKSVGAEGNNRVKVVQHG
jgi:hypothetical protein